MKRSGKPASWECPPLPIKGPFHGQASREGRLVPHLAGGGPRVGGACGSTGARGLFGRKSASRSALPEPVGFAVHLQDVDMVGDAVERRAGEVLAGEDRGSFMEGQVQGNDGGAVLVAPAEDVKQEFAFGLQGWHIDELVDDEGAGPRKLDVETEPPLLVARLGQLGDCPISRGPTWEGKSRSRSTRIET